MKKQKTKAKGSAKEAGAQAQRGQVVKLRPPKAKPPARRLPSPGAYLGAARQFVVEAWQELKKVTWPNRRETLGTTLVVLVLVMIISAFLGLVDLTLSRLVSTVIH